MFELENVQNIKNETTHFRRHASSERGDPFAPSS